jgi:hypothetical protein
MSLEIFIFFNHVDDFHESLEEALVVTVIEGFEILPQKGNVTDHCQNIWRVNNFFLDSFSILSDHSCDNSVENKIFVAH